jgi:hypothetical protein
VNLVFTSNLPAQTAPTYLLAWSRGKTPIAVSLKRLSLAIAASIALILRPDVSNNMIEYDGSCSLDAATREASGYYVVSKDPRIANHETYYSRYFMYIGLDERSATSS